MKIRYEMTSRAVGKPSYEPPDESLVRETNNPDVEQAVDAFNEFLLAVFGAGWRVELSEVKDEYSN